MRRKPKTLTSRPVLIEFADIGNQVADTQGSHAGGTTPGVGYDTSASSVDAPAGASNDIDAAAVHKRAQALAAQLAIRRPRRRVATRPGPGQQRSVPFANDVHDLDLERTIEVLAENPAATGDDVIVREPRTSRRSVVLLVDLSGSMRGERAMTVAAVVGALCHELADSRLAVLAFWSQAAWVTRMKEPTVAQRVVRDLLRIPVEGLTNIAFPLEIAAAEHRAARSPRPETVLLSDCLHNAGPDPRALVRRAGKVGVLLDASEEHDVELASDLARLGGGQLRAIRSVSDVPGAVHAIFSR